MTPKLHGPGSLLEDPPDSGNNSDRSLNHDMVPKAKDMIW